MSPIQFRPGAEKRFNRLKSLPLRTIQDERRVSVIMPAFNSETTLAIAAGSILNQSWRNLELINVDDASTDSTWPILNKLASQDQRVCILRNSVNVGPCVSKNRALSHATGDFLTGHDADDWAMPERIERQIQSLLEDRAKAAVAHMLCVEEEIRFCQIAERPVKTHDGASQRAYIFAFFDGRLSERLWAIGRVCASVLTANC